MGAPLMVHGTLLACKPWGMVPAPLTVLPLNRVLTNKRPTATQIDTVPLMNIPSFGMCTSMANPAVLATAPVFKAPCMPAPVGPWMMPSMRVMGGGKPFITTSACLMCMWGGMIKAQMPGQIQTTAAAPAQEFLMAF